MDGLEGRNHKEEERRIGYQYNISDLFLIRKRCKSKTKFCAISHRILIIRFIT